MAVWRALAPRANLGVDACAPSTPLVGRDHELGLLRDTLGRIRRELTAQLITLVGVPGIGKSRLVSELLALVEAEPELTTWRQGRPALRRGVAFWALGEMVKARGDPGDRPSRGGRRQTGRSQTGLLEDGAEAAWVAGHLRPLVGLAGSGRVGR